MSPGQLLLMRRKGPAMAPGAPALPAPPGAAAPNAGVQLGEELAKLLGGQPQQDFVVQVLDNMKRQSAVLIAKLNQSHPSVAKHLVRAYSALDAGLSEAKKVADNQQQAMGRNPLTFTGAAMGQAPEQSPIPGAPPVVSA